MKTIKGALASDPKGGSYGAGGSASVKGRAQARPQRLSPGVYRNASGQLSNASGRAFSGQPQRGQAARGPGYGPQGQANVKGQGQPRGMQGQAGGGAGYGPQGQPVPVNGQAGGQVGFGPQDQANVQGFPSGGMQGSAGGGQGYSQQGQANVQGFPSGGQGYSQGNPSVQGFPDQQQNQWIPQGGGQGQIDPGRYPQYFNQNMQLQGMPRYGSGTGVSNMTQQQRNPNYLQGR
jgi:hypothetical protein